MFLTRDMGLDMWDNAVPKVREDMQLLSLHFAFCLDFTLSVTLFNSYLHVFIRTWPIEHI